MVLPLARAAATQVELPALYAAGDKRQLPPKLSFTLPTPEGKRWAEQANLAQLELAFCYKYGNGVPKDMDEAIRLFTLAAEQGNAKARRELDRCYREKEDSR